MRKRSARSNQRRGATAVEFAVIAFPLFLLIFASIEIGRTMMVLQSLEEAARAGCRVAILKGATTVEVENAAIAVLNKANIPNSTIGIEPESLDDAPLWGPVGVTVSAPLDDASWLPAMFVGGINPAPRGR